MIEPPSHLGLLPWQEETWQTLSHWHDKLPHALLLHGPAGIGKTQLAHVFAQSLLCSAPTSTGLPCGACQSCHWFAQGNHPDCRVIRPDSLEAEAGESDAESNNQEKTDKNKTPSREIRIEQIRQLADFLAIGTHRGGRRIVFLYPAQSLNTYAANALLKMLEEPTAHTIFILVTDQLDRLLPTLLSRCRKVAIAPPRGIAAQERAQQWLVRHGYDHTQSHIALTEAGGMPLQALSLLQNRTETASSAQGGASFNTDAWVRELARLLLEPNADAVLKLANYGHKESLPLLLQTTQRWAHDLSRLAIGLPAQFYPHIAKQINRPAQKLALQAVTTWAQALRERQRIVNHPLNPRLFVEELLLEYRQKVGRL
ncbi:DNA polymerase III subunit delta' [Parvibium lacunae]|uniref:DNA polymerase III subunit delta n=1 Tax=Parvibium lacunae TaxID=1888893 RepID=A0A368L7I6_9BURK|nr:DNA polymerase III subunit delta' [Parvibium lacunae]RCS59630.1 DNA polymerase III subunit delta' [Parvibium lacunae]